MHGSLEVNQSGAAWPHRSDRPRWAGVSSFGFGDTNAYVTLEAAPQIPEAPMKASNASSPTPPFRHLLVLSATQPEALRPLAQSYGTFLERAKDEELAAICVDAYRQRSALPSRLVVHGKDRPVADCRAKRVSQGREHG